MEITYEAVEWTVENMPVSYGSRIVAKLAKLAKRLTKMGAPAPTVEFGPVITIEETVEADSDAGFSIPTDLKMTTEVFETVTVKGFEAKADGWTGVAVLDWTVSTDEAFVARFPGHTDEETAVEISDHLRTRGPVCDHCSTTRRRNNTIVFTHDDGRMIAVGTGCVLEYLGVDPRTILMLSDFVRSLDEGDECGPVAKRTLDPVEYVALASEITRHFGFVKSGEGNSTKELTTSIGIIGLTTSKADRALAEELADAIDMDRGRVKAAEIAAWIEADESGSDFLRSAKVALNGNPVEAGARHSGILAALPFSHDRHIGLVAERAAKRAAEADARVIGKFVGSVGDKITVTGEVVFYNVYDGTYGAKARVTILTTDGDRVTTYGSGNTVFGWATGDKVEMTGKVKGHDDHATFGKSTDLSHAKLTELGDDGKPLPNCEIARCTRPAGPACDTCGKAVCANGHGRGYLDGFYCDTCLDELWDAEEARTKTAKAMVKAASTLLGAPTAPTYSYNSSFRPTPAELDILVPA